MSRVLKLTLAYDGTDYVGWQRQTNGRSIQQVVEEAIGAFVPGGPRIVVEGASRTDAGVHALGQVASAALDVGFDTATIQRALNIRLPVDVRVLAVEDAPPAFHARFRSRGKSYQYRIGIARVASPFSQRYSWHSPGIRDLPAMRAAATALLGEHDFSSFQTAGSDPETTVRTITRLDVLEQDQEVVIVIDGTGFLRHMVRAIVGTLAEVGWGGRPAASVAEVLASRDRRAAGRTAPACGLFLTSVHY